MFFITGWILMLVLGGLYHHGIVGEQWLLNYWLCAGIMLVPDLLIWRNLNKVTSR